MQMVLLLPSILLLRAGVGVQQDVALPPTHEKCSLNGHLSASGSCVCRPAWKGPGCASLVLQPARKVFEVPKGWTAWGAAPIADEQGNWHMFVAVYKTWHFYNPYSHVIHVKAPAGAGPDGPYSSWMAAGDGETIFPPYTCSPAVVKTRDSGGPLYLLYGSHSPWNPPAGYDPQNPPAAHHGGLVVASSRSLNGPWNVTRAGWDELGLSPGNPSIVVLDNGTFIFGSDTGSNGGVLKAPGPYGPWSPLKASCKGRPDGGGLCAGGGDWLWLKSPNTSGYFVEVSIYGCTCLSLTDSFNSSPELLGFSFP
eukprot:COSAG05_NODE_4854_length_1347_cov_1.686699_2_plen_309_part_00